MLNNKQKQYIERLFDIAENNNRYITSLSYENILSLRKLGRDYETLEQDAIRYGMDCMFEKRAEKAW